MSFGVFSCPNNHGVYRCLPNKTTKMSTYVSSCLRSIVTFNHGVEGSSPSALTIEFVGENVSFAHLGILDFLLRVSPRVTQW
jgi:hypothetical protein